MLLILCQTTQAFLMPAVAEVVSGQASLASCARRYPVNDKRIRKGVRNHISGEVVQLERRGPKPGVDDKKIAAWLEAQRKATLPPYKYVDVTRLAVYSRRCFSTTAMPSVLCSPQSRGCRRGGQDGFGASSKRTPNKNNVREQRVQTVEEAPPRIHVPHTAAGGVRPFRRPPDKSRVEMILF